MNAKKVPHLFLSTGASRFIDPKGAPWSMAFLAGYEIEGAVYATHIVKTNPNARIAVLSQADDYGRDLVRGFKAGLGDGYREVAGSPYPCEDDSSRAHARPGGSRPPPTPRPRSRRDLGSRAARGDVIFIYPADPRITGDLRRSSRDRTTLSDPSSPRAVCIRVTDL